MVKMTWKNKTQEQKNEIIKSVYGVDADVSSCVRFTLGGKELRIRVEGKDEEDIDFDQEFESDTVIASKLTNGRNAVFYKK